ncbi:SDR family oxidoreductase [Glaciecola sp. XM2]|jgi:NAD(P)-dependent dehydrogenase (short-subunit alcohol dehydrogenase family)|uniref:SDR family oxidoreductase n=1 Tax=Glaciecola sp. XM2 TaxID=1914931 RepID=UPI001BDDED28|nr:SDR family oxidoreductase [Glaciecola sp. XM2]MBT1449338.1 SDR family oxidoreductase [Glaciecola sp. XM2]
MTINKRIFITGGASGLGKAIAIHYAKQGYAVAIGDISQPNLNATESELRELTSDVLALVCDTTSEESLVEARKSLEEQFGGVDILVNNAGVAGTYGDIGSVELDAWHKVLDVNLMGVVRGCKVFAQLFKHQQSGAIVNIASMAGILTPPNSGAYNASKAAVIALSETVRFELCAYNVSVHAVCPAFFKTNLTDSMQGNPKAKAFVDREMAKSTITAADVAAMIDKQIQSNKLMLLTHKTERRLWRLKRFIPSLYERLLTKAFLKTIKKQIGSKA